MFFNPNFDKQRHWEIFLKPRGTIIPLPGENSGVIVNWQEPNCLQIGTILPSGPRAMTAQWSRRNGGGTHWMDPKDCEIECPQLLLRTWIGQDRGDGIPPLALDEWHMQNRLLFDVNLLTMAERTNGVQLKGFRIGNVYDDGRICWGEVQLGTDPRVVNNLLWSSPMNNDAATSPQHGANCDKIKHRNERCGSAASVHRHQHISQVCRCSERRRDLSHEKAPVCNYCAGLVSENPELKIELINRVGKICICCSGSCDAGVEGVAAAAIQCRCRCLCCVHECEHYCECDLTDEFIEYMRTKASPEELKKLRWKDNTATVLGRHWENEKCKQFFAFGDHADALFISYEKEIIENVQSSLVRKHGAHKMVVGPAFQTSNGDWEVDLGGQIIQIPACQGYVINSGVVLSPAEMERRAEAERNRQQERERLQREREERRRRLSELGRTDQHPICDECGDCRTCNSCGHEAPAAEEPVDEGDGMPEAEAEDPGDNVVEEAEEAEDEDEDEEESEEDEAVAPAPELYPF